MDRIIIAIVAPSAINYHFTSKCDILPILGDKLEIMESETEWPYLLLLIAKHQMQKFTKMFPYIISHYSTYPLMYLMGTNLDCVYF